MRHTLYTDYSLRLLLLALECEERHTIEEVARRCRISHNHLMKIAQTLVQAVQRMRRLLAPASAA